MLAFRSIKAARARLITVVIVDDSLFRPAEAAAHSDTGFHAKAAHPVSTPMPEAVEYRFHAFEGQRAGRNARGGLHGAAQEAGLAGTRRHILRLSLVLCRRWRSVLRNRLVRRRLLTTP